MSPQPVVTVLMSVFNDLQFLPLAISSILEQTWDDLELLIIDDGSTDGCVDFLVSIHDPRLRVLHNERNVGLTLSLRRGIELARGLYIARMDADDIALPQRLAKQVAFMEGHPSVGLLGSACWLIDREGRTLGRRFVLPGNLQIRWQSLLTNPFLHPTVMVRRDVLVRNALNYDEAFRQAQDYDLWTRMLRHTQGANLEEPLIRYRLRDGITATHRSAQLLSHDAIAWRTIQGEMPGFAITREQVSQLRALFWGAAAPEVRGSQPNILLDLYVQMLRRFLSRYPRDRESRLLWRQEIFRAMRLALRVPLRGSSLRLIAKLLTLAPSCSYLYVRHLWRAIGERVAGIWRYL